MSSVPLPRARALAAASALAFGVLAATAPAAFADDSSGGMRRPLEPAAAADTIFVQEATPDQPG
jgi:hypothetical protein